MNEHIDIFSGIGGFAIAAQRAGFRTIAFCESDQRCRTFLEKTWSKPVHADIRTLDAKLYRGVSLLTGGPPCQPASRAGKQGGSGDNRWLWPEALRVLGEAEPDCVVFENPPGIGDVGLDGILSEMGRLGYEVQVFDIPACAVDSPQLRHRFWIVGFLADAKVRGQRTNGSASGGGRYADERDQSGVLADSNEGRIARATGRRQSRRSENELADTASPGRERPDAERGENGCRPQRPQSLVADAERERRERGGAESRQTEGGKSFGATTGLHWQNSVWVPCADGKLRRAPDDSFGLVDGLHRSLLAALGNSIVPEEAFRILSAVRACL